MIYSCDGRIVSYIIIDVFYFIVSGVFAIRADRENVMEEDFLKAVCKIVDN